MRKVFESGFIPVLQSNCSTGKTKPHFPVGKCGLCLGCCGLKVKFAAKLDSAWVAEAIDLALAILATTTHGKRRRSSRRVRRSAKAEADVVGLRMIEDVINLEAQLQAHVFAKREVLEEGHIPIIDSRASEGIAADVADAADCRFGKSGRVEPVLPAAM